MVVIWISGLPGSGKSTIAKLVAEKLGMQRVSLDEIRKKFVPEPRYSEKERELVYGKLVEVAVDNVILDATAHKKEWRDKAREKFSSFIEVYVKCPIETCMKRESRRQQGLVMAEMYRKALERKKSGTQYAGLGDVIGVDVEFEENPKAEVVVNSDKLSAEESSEIIIRYVKSLPSG